LIVIHRNYLIFWIFINAIAELVADLVVRSFFDEFLSIVCDLERTNQLNLLPDKD